MGSKWITGVALFLGIGTLAGVATLYLRARAASRAEAEAEEALEAAAKAAAKATKERAARQEVVAVVAPAPLPTALPVLVGKNGRRTIDRPAFRSLLHHKRFADLTRYVETLQAAFEKDPLDEDPVADLADTFCTSEPELREALQAWAAASPASFAPSLALGAHFREVAAAKRGGDTAARTHTDNLKEMRATAEVALHHLDRAIELRPKLVAAMGQAIGVAMMISDHARIEALAKQATAACPTCYRFRASLLWALEPRWGGSYEEMAAVARAAPKHQNPRLALLAGAVDADKADVLREDKKLDEALAVINRACALGESPTFLFARAGIQLARKEDAAALVDVERVLALRPGLPAALAMRAELLGRQRHFERAARDLVEVLQGVPTHGHARALRPWVVQGLLATASEKARNKQREEALRVVELAVALDPRSGTAQSLHNAIVLGVFDKGDPVPATADLEAKAKAAPDDFRAVQQLDYALARQRRYGEVVTLWTDFLSRHPQDGRAHLERGGAHFNLGQLEAALSDAKAACDLGVGEGCARAKQVAGRLGRR